MATLRMSLSNPVGTGSKRSNSGRTNSGRANPVPVPEGTADNSPAFQRRVACAEMAPRPGGDA